MILDRRSALLIAPVGIAAAAGLGVWAALNHFTRVGFDPGGVPTALNGKHIPPFELPGIIDGGFKSTDLADAGVPVLVVFWASWSPPCVTQQALLLDLRKQGVAIWGVAYKDTKINAAAFLQKRGNPFVRSARDDPGRAGVDWGINDVPESFVVDREGIVRWHMPGPLSHAIATQQLLPALQRLTS